MPTSSRDRLRGTLELLVLRTLAWGPRHGYAIARWLEDTSATVIRVEEGSLYPALYRMEQRGLDRQRLAHVGARAVGEVLPSHAGRQTTPQAGNVGMVGVRVRGVRGPGAGAMSPRREQDEITRPAVDRRVSAELAFHIEMRTRELVEQGMDPDEARRQATARFGDIDQVSAQLERLERQTDRVVRRTQYFAELRQDARFAVRMLARRRSFAAIAIGTLALGIGAATAIYSVVDGVLLRPLPFDAPDRIAAVWITQPSLAKDPTISWLADGTPMGNEEYQALRRSITTIRDLAMYGSGTITLTTNDGTERVQITQATSSLLPALRARVALGRAFQPGDDALNGPNVAMLSWEAWQSRYGGDSSVIGRSVTLDGKPRTVIGVLPPGLRIDRTTEPAAFWLPALQDSSDLPQRHNRNYRALARLVPGATFAAASREAVAILRTVTGDTSLSARVEQWQRDQGRDARGPLFVLLGAVGLLLLIACVNVAILQLGEAAGRAREMAARAALGAGAARLVRQLLVESLVIAAVSALLGTALAWAMTRGLVAMAPERLPGIDTVTIDARVLGFTMACAVATGLLFGIVPALIAGRTQATMAGRVGGGQTASGTKRLQRTLIAAQLALSMVLLVEAALLGRSLNKLGNVDPGFRPAGLTAFHVSLPWRIGDDASRAFTAEVIRRLSTMPGVERVTAAASQVPFSGGGSSSPVQVEPIDGATAKPGLHTQQRYIVPGYFETMGLRLIAGRTFTADDRAGAEPVAVLSVSETQRAFGTESPLGRRVKHQGAWRRIVGVVADVKFRGLGQEDEPTIYVPFDQHPGSAPVFVVRGSAGRSIEPALKTMIREVDPRSVLTKTSAMPQLIEKSYAAERYRTMLVSVFGAMAALLAAVGLYGVSVRAAGRRAREIGIRLALGGTSSTVVRLLVGDAMGGVLIGLAARNSRQRCSRGGSSRRTCSRSVPTIRYRS